MSQTQTDAEAPARKKQGPKPKAAAIEPILEDPNPEEIPEGMCACYVAVPNKVSNGTGVAKAKPGERVIGSIKNMDELELRGVAFRNEDEAKAAFTSFKRKREAEIKRAVEVERIRRERRERIKAELHGANDELEWHG